MDQTPLIHGLLTAATVGLVLCLLRRAGPRASGLAAAIPITSMPALAWLAWDQGAAPAAVAAGAAMSTTALTGVFAVAYARRSQRACTWGAFVAATLPTLVVAGSISPVSGNLAVMAIVAAALLGACTWMLPAVAALDRSTGKRRRHDLLMASAVAGCVTALIGYIAPGVSPAICGLVSAIPVVGACSMVTVGRHDGTAALIAFMHGYVRGLWAKAAFYGILAWALPQRVGGAAWLLATGAGFAAVLIAAPPRRKASGMFGLATITSATGSGGLLAAFTPSSGSVSSVARRVPWARAVLAGLIGLSLLLMDEGCLAADPDWSIEPYCCFLHWVSVRRFDLALDQFADDAVVVSGPGCPQTMPCVGKSAILKGYLAAVEARRISLPLPERFDGGRLKSHGEIVVVTTECGHRVRLRGDQVFEFRDGRIASIRVALDARDPPTAAYMARQAALGAFAHAP